MCATSMGRNKMISFDKYGWHLYLKMIKREMISHYKRKTVNAMIDKLNTTSEGSVSIKRRKAFNFINSG